MPQPREQYFEVVEGGHVIGMANQEPGGWWQALYGKHERLGTFARPVDARAAIVGRHRGVQPKEPPRG